METLFQKVTTFTYFSGAVGGALSMFAMPLTYGGPVWEFNVLVTSIGVGLVAITSITSALALLSKNFPIPMSLVTGTVLVVAIAGQLEGPNAMLALLQQIALVLLGFFIVTRILIESLSREVAPH
jgi:hypothetical protein